MDTLLEPENRATLTKVQTYHVVSGRLSASDVFQSNGVIPVINSVVMPN